MEITLKILLGRYILPGGLLLWALFMLLAQQ